MSMHQFLTLLDDLLSFLVNDLIFASGTVYTAFYILLYLHPDDRHFRFLGPYRRHRSHDLFILEKFESWAFVVYAVMFIYFLWTILSEMSIYTNWLPRSCRRPRSIKWFTRNFISHVDSVDYEVVAEHVKYVSSRPNNASLRKWSQEFYEIVSARRSLRFFSRDPVPRDVIRTIIKTAGTSPSGAHTQPWTFVAVSNVDVKESIRAIVEREEKINYTQRMGEEWTNDLKPLNTDWRKEYLTDAPWLILVFKQDYSVLPCGKKKRHYYKETSVSIACGILITAIQYCGLVTLTSTPLNCGAALRELLKRPANEKLVLLLPVGYPAADATVPALKRKDLEEILVEIE